MYPETRNTFDYLKKEWHVTVAYIIGFFIMNGLLGWNPHQPYKKAASVPAVSEQAVASKSPSLTWPELPTG